MWTTEQAWGIYMNRFISLNSSTAISLPVKSDIQPKPVQHSTDDHTRKTNWTLGFKHVQALYRSPSVHNGGSWDGSPFRSLGWYHFSRGWPEYTKRPLHVVFWTCNALKGKRLTSTCRLTAAGDSLFAPFTGEPGCLSTSPPSSSSTWDEFNVSEWPGPVERGGQAVLIEASP